MGQIKQWVFNLVRRMGWLEAFIGLRSAVTCLCARLFKAEATQRNKAMAQLWLSTLQEVLLLPWEVIHRGPSLEARLAGT